jgi:hypothetical protein
MLQLFWIVLFLVAACLILLMPSLWGKQIYDSYRGARTVNCPETHAPVSVRFRAFRAAISGLSGKPKLALADCSRWPVHADCGQECIPDAARSAPEQALPVFPPRTRKIFHLPVLLAAAVAWVLGMAWHSEYLFRPQWMTALRLSDRDTRVLAEMWTPHLLTVAACLVFAYGVAWLLAWAGTRTAFRGIGVALLLWLAIAAALMATTRSVVAPQLIWLEGCYTLLAALFMGAIVGGAPRRLLLKDSE